MRTQGPPRSSSPVPCCSLPLRAPCSLPLRPLLLPAPFHPLRGGGGSIPSDFLRRSAFAAVFDSGDQVIGRTGRLQGAAMAARPVPTRDDPDEEVESCRSQEQLKRGEDFLLPPSLSCPDLALCLPGEAREGRDPDPRTREVPGLPCGPHQQEGAAVRVLHVPRQVHGSQPLPRQGGSRDAPAVAPSSQSLDPPKVAAARDSRTGGPGGRWGHLFLRAGASNEDEYGGFLPWVYANDHQLMQRRARPGLCGPCKCCWLSKDPRGVFDTGGGLRARALGGPSAAGRLRGLDSRRPFWVPSDSAGLREGPEGGPSESARPKTLH